MIKPKNLAKAFFSMILLFSMFQYASAQKPPVAPVREVVDDYYGTKISDPYRYMENLKEPDVQAWMKGQAEYTDSVLKRIPGRDAMLKRIQEIEDAVGATPLAVVRLPNGK